MKQFIFIFCLYLLSSGAFAQSDSDDFGKISLAVIMPDNADNLSAADLSKIESKIHKLVTRYGLSGSGYNNNFVIYPKFEIYSESVVEGMRNITVVETEFNLFIKQVDNNMMFASYSKSIKGSGFDKSKALKDAISKIPSTDPKVQAFIQEGKEKILDYFTKNCETIILQAEDLTKRDEYEQAIGLLLSIPSEVGECYTLAQSKAVEAYDAYKERYCVKLLTFAKTEFEKNNFDKALDYIAQMDASTDCHKEAEKLVAANQEKLCKQYLLMAKTSIVSQDYYNASGYLMRINPETSCYNEAQSLIKEIEQKITAAEKLEHERKREKEKEQFQLEKYRISAAKEVAKAYYTSRPQTINYTTILR